MGIVRRLILLFYILTVLAVLVVCAGVCLQLIPTSIWQSELNFIIEREETLTALACMTLASLILLTMVFSGSKSSKGLALATGDVHLEEGKPGEVKVSVPAIVSVVESAAITVNGVREVAASVYRQTGDMPIKVHLTITLAQGYSAPKVSEDAVATVDAALSTALELFNVPVEVRVDEVTHAIIERDKRVV